MTATAGAGRDRRVTVRLLLVSPLRRRPRAVLALAVWSAIEAVPAYLSGRLVAQALDDGFLAHRAGRGFAWLALLAAAVAAGAWATRHVYRRLADVVEPLRDELVASVVTGSLRGAGAPGWRPEAAGVARLTEHVEVAREAYASVLLAVQGFTVTSAGALIGLATLAPLALLLVVPPLVLALAVFAAAMRGTAGRQRAAILADERLAGSTAATAAALRDVVASGGEELVVASVGEHVDAQARATVALARFTALRTLAAALGGWVPVVLVVGFAPWLRAHGATTGAVLGVLTYLLQGLHPALQALVRQIGGTGAWLAVTARRIVESAAVEAATPTAAGTRPRGAVAGGDAGPTQAARADARGAVRLRGVTFAYGPASEPVVRDLALDLAGGGHLAIVGPSGAGKSTLANLIAGVLAPQAGEVLVDGVPAAALRGVPARRVLIPQEAYVFAGTLRENLAYLDPEASDAALDRAAAELGARGLVARLGGLDAEIVPAALSAGERQLLTLVRAHVTAADLIVLDEATCHLDAGTEACIEDVLRRRPGTLVVVAHRISSALRARRVVVLDGGGALVGTHLDLIGRSTLYRDMVGHWEAGLGAGREAARRRAAASARRLRLDRQRRSRGGCRG